MSHLYTDATPSPVKNAQGIHLITQSTPNGQKIQILLEELKEAYGDTVQWTTSLVDISTGEQKKEWFLRLNPNGRIPVIVDNTVNPPHPVMETSSELLYLAQKLDKGNKFGFEDPVEQSQLLQWLFFWHGSGAPYMGQVGHFFKFAEEKVPYAMQRYKNEVLRVFGVLEIHLSGKFTGEPRDYLAGKGKGKYSLADIGTWSWVSRWQFLDAFDKDTLEKSFPHLLKYIARIQDRPAVLRGVGDKYSWDKNPELRVSTSV